MPWGHLDNQPLHAEMRQKIARQKRKVCVRLQILNAHNDESLNAEPVPLDQGARTGKKNAGRTTRQRRLPLHRVCRAPRKRVNKWPTVHNRLDSGH